MTIRTPSRRIRVPSPRAPLILDDFSGGLNYRDPPMVLAGSETQDALNVHAIGRTLQKRPGAPTVATLATAGKYIFYSSLFGVAIVQRGTAVYSYDTATWTATQIIASGMSTKIACVEFTGLVVITTAAGVYTWNGSGSATLRSAVPSGTTIAVWQNKVWIGTVNTLYWSAAGDATTWTTGVDFVQIREPDDAAIASLGVGNGLDVVGRDGLFVFKSNSGHKVIDSETGEYVTLWAGDNSGAMGHESVASLDGTVYFMNVLGMWRLAGDVPERISARIDPVGQYSWSNELDVSCVFPSGDRILFSRNSSSTIWEFVPRTGAWWRHSLYTGSVYRHAISAAVRGADASVGERAYLIDSGGTAIVRWDPWHLGLEGRDYTASTLPCAYATPWMSFGLVKTRVRRAIIEGWGTNVALSLKSGYQGTLTSFDADLDFATVATSVFSGTVERFGFGVHSALSLYFAESSGVTGPFGPINKSTLDPVNQYLTGFGLNAIRLDTATLQ